MCIVVVVGAWGRTAVLFVCKKEEMVQPFFPFWTDFFLGVVVVLVVDVVVGGVGVGGLGGAGALRYGPGDLCGAGSGVVVEGRRATTVSFEVCVLVAHLAFLLGVALLVVEVVDPLAEAVVLLLELAHDVAHMFRLLRARVSLRHGPLETLRQLRVLLLEVTELTALTLPRHARVLAVTRPMER